MNMSVDASSTLRAATPSMTISGGGGTIHVSSQIDGTANTLRPDAGTAPATPSCPQDSLSGLAAIPKAVARGRRHVRETLWEWKLDGLTDDAELVSSELLTNAVKASMSLDCPGLMLRLLADAKHLAIEVYDHSLLDPVARNVDGVPEGGRGFVVVQALADSWGYHRFHAALKVVWAELRIAEH